MATHYVENASSGNQYYFNANDATTSHSYQTYSSPVRSTHSSSTYTTYPVNVSGLSGQSMHFDSYQVPQNYQSVAGFKSVAPQYYQPPISPTHQSRTTVRAVSSQDRYNVQRSPQTVQAIPQQIHVQYDNRQRSGQPTGPPVVYQTPGAAQFTHRNVDLWTESPSQNNDYNVQAQRVSVRSVSTGSPQQAQSVSSQRQPDHLQQYYSQLTPEQHQQLLHHQQIQRQQEQNSRHEQQHRVTAQQVSPSSVHHHQQQYHSTAHFDGGQQNQQRFGRSESEKQLQDEQDYYAAQRRLAAQRAQQQQQQQQIDPSHPVGIQNLMNKFAPPTSVQTINSRSKSTTTTTTTRHHSSSGYPTASRSRQTAAPTNRTLTSYSMTYSALPKPVEPPVNSIEYYQMQMQQSGGAFANIQQAAAPPHIQHTATGLGALRDRFKTGSLSDDFNKAPSTARRPEQQYVQQQVPNNRPGNSLSSLRNQYMHQAQQPVYDESYAQQVPVISRTILGEESPQTKLPVFSSQGTPQQQQPPTQVLVEEQLQPSPQVFLKQAPSKAEAPKQEPVPTPTAQPPQQEVAVATQLPQQEVAPVTQAPQQQSAPSTETSQPQSTPITETPQQQPAPIAEASQQQPATPKETPKKEATSKSQPAKKEPASTTQTIKKESTPTTQASKDKVASAPETKKEQSQKNNESSDQKSSSSEATASSTANGETA